MKAAIRLVWSPIQDRTHLMDAMTDAGFSRDARRRMLANLVETIAEVEIAADGSMTVLRSRAPGPCNEVRDGVPCDGGELHRGLHYGEKDGGVVTWANPGHPDDIRFDRE